MMGGGKAGKPTANEVPRLASLRVQTSSYGTPRKIVFGTQRISASLLDYDDFKAIAHTSVQKVGGKGGGSGSQNVTTVSYTYQAAVMLMLCEGPIQGILQVWDYKGVASSTPGVETWALTSSPITVVNAASFLYDVGVALVTSVSVWVEDDYDYGQSHFGNTSRGHFETQTQSTPMVKTTGTPAAGQYKVVAGVYTFNAADVGVGNSVAITYRFGASAALGSSPVGAFGLTLFNGSNTQTPWSYMVSAHPSKALGYRNSAYLANSALDLGANGEIPQYSFEVVGLAVATGSNSLDANLADVLPLMLSNTRYGVGMPSSSLGDYSLLRQYLNASGLLLSPVLDGQRATSEILTELFRAANSAPVWSEGVLKVIPYGERQLVGNGSTYTPNMTPVYDLSEVDFIAEAGSPPVTVHVADDKDLWNKRTVEFFNRANNYNAEPVDLEDQADIELYGLRSADIEALHCITQKSVALLALDNILKRGLYTEPYSYEFKLSWKYVRLECMDLVTLTCASLGMSKLPVRIRSIEEDEEGVLTIIAEPLAFGTATATLYPKQLVGGAQVDRLVSPGTANAPLIFEIPDSLSESVGSYEVRLAVSGSNPNWGGASIWFSEDNATFKYLGKVYGPARQGVLQSSLASHADPDTVDTLSVDLTESAGILLSGTDADRDSARTLMYLDNASTGYGEFISYKTATLTAASKYDLTSLRRGLFGSAIQAFASSVKCTRVDDALFSVLFDARVLGKTLYIKLTSFNIYGLAEQSIADVTATSFTLGGAFNNFGQLVGNDATVDSLGDGTAPFTTATIRGYGQASGVPTVGHSILLKKNDGSSRTTVAFSQSGLSLSTIYYLMLKPSNDTKYLLTAYSAMTAAVANGDILLGKAVTPDSGGSGGTSGGGGGGYGGGGGDAGGGCVVIDAMIDETAAGQFKIGMLATILNVSDETRSRRPLKRRNSNRVVRCVRLELDNGAWLDCAWDTPFDTKDREGVLAESMNGKLVATDDGDGTPLEWSAATVKELGYKWVAPLDFDGTVFASRMPKCSKRVYSHNSLINKVL